MLCIFFNSLSLESVNNNAKVIPLSRIIAAILKHIARVDAELAQFHLNAPAPRHAVAAPSTVTTTVVAVPVVRVARDGIRAGYNTRRNVAQVRALLGSCLVARRAREAQHALERGYLAVGKDVIEHLAGLARVDDPDAGTGLPSRDVVARVQELLNRRINNSKCGR